MTNHFKNSTLAIHDQSAATPEPAQPTVPVELSLGSRRQAQTIVLIVATTLGLYLCYRLTIPFLSPLAWAFALAILCYPLHRRIVARSSRPSLMAAFTVLMVALTVMVVASFVGQRLIQEATKGVEIVRAKVEKGDWRRVIQSYPRLAPIAARLEQQFNLAGTIKTVGTWITNTGASLVKGSVVQVIQLILTFYLLFYFLRDAHKVLDALRALLPLTKPETDRMFRRVSDTIYASIYGTLAVSAVQGLLGGLMFWWLGLPAPLLWGVVMALLAIVPVLGAFVVWIPAALFLALEGSWGKALILTAWGAIVVGGVDNVLRPILVGNRLQLHTIPVFISVVGGIVLFGASGLILGPLVLTITTQLLEIWYQRTADTAQMDTKLSTEIESR